MGIRIIKLMGKCRLLNKAINRINIGGKILIKEVNMRVWIRRIMILIVRFRKWNRWSSLRFYRLIPALGTCL